MWKLLFKKCCWKTCFLAFIKKKCVWYHNLNNMFQHLKNIKNVFGTCVYFYKKSWSYVRIFFFKIWIAQRREENEMTVQRKGDKIKKKKLISGSIDSQKSWVNVFKFITNLPSEMCVQCLKSPPATFQNILFKHWFFGNNFPTTAFWTDRPNIYFCHLDTSVQCLNTEHYVLSW